MGARAVESKLEVIDLGRMAYAEAFEVQVRHHGEVLAGREREDAPIGRLLLVEHDPPVITVSRRPGARAHLVATDELLARHGVEVCETDRGGDITYHGPGQLVVYPIIDLNRVGGGLGLHAYMRMLEGIVIDVCARFGVKAGRDPGATGVWVGEGISAKEQGRARLGEPALAPSQGARKICAMGIRVRRWVTMHGLALNVATNPDHFALIVPCGLVGRAVTSLAQELGEACPSMDEVKGAMVEACARAMTLGR